LNANDVKPRPDKKTDGARWDIFPGSFEKAGRQRGCNEGSCEDRETELPESVTAARGPSLELRGLKHFRQQENQPLVLVHARLVHGLAVVEY
jgi:hypothetical protein